MIAEVITIGDELLRGEIIDSNKSYLSERLLEIDVHTRFHCSVLDHPGDMTDAFLRAADRSDIVLVSGGLGPTRDDITLEVLAATFGRKLELHAPSLDRMREFFKRFGREMSPSNEKQAYFPAGSEVLPNPEGTAPGCMLDTGGTVFFCMPGVPRELYRMMIEQVTPRVAARAGTEDVVVRSAILRTFGIGESTLEDELADIAREEHVQLGFRTTFPDNFLRPVARGATVAEAEAHLAHACQAIEDRLGALVYGRDDDSMEIVVGRLLREGSATLAVAESCTGGMLGERVTSVPGSSAWFLGGVQAYSNAVKHALLGVPEAMLAEHGAVSEPVARAMAEGARDRIGATWALSTTGISGPDGGTDDKPVGTVWVGRAGPDGSTAQEFVFPFDRHRNRQATVQIALDGLRRVLLGVEAEVPRWLNQKGRA